MFPGPRGGQTTGAYALPIGDRTLCVYLTWDAATTQDELMPPARWSSPSAVNHQALAASGSTSPSRWLGHRLMCRIAFCAISVGLLTSACANAAPSATSPTTAASAAASEPQASPSTQPVADTSVPPDAAAAWTGPVRSRPATAATMDPGEPGTHSASDPSDAARRYVDIESVVADVPEQPHWRLLLTAAPPKATTLDPTRTSSRTGWHLRPAVMTVPITWWASATMHPRPVSTACGSPI